MAETKTEVEIAEAPPPQQSKVEQFVGEVLPPQKWESLTKGLPLGLRPEVFKRNLTNAIMKEPKLLNVDPRKVFREVSKIAALGLLLDPHLQEAWLIADSKGEVQARIGYRGLIKLTRQSDEVSFVNARDICMNDYCEVEQGTSQRLVHKIDPKTDRGDPASYYAVVQFKDGSVDFELMSMTQIYKIRDRSDGYRAFKAGKIRSTPWASDEEEMAKKTALRRLCKRLPMSPDKADLVAQMLAREDEAEFSEFKHTAALPAPSPLHRRAIERQAGPQIEEPGMNGDQMERVVNGEEKPAETKAAPKKEVAKTSEATKNIEKPPVSSVQAAQGAGAAAPVASNLGDSAPAPAAHQEEHDPETGEIREEGSSDDPPWDETPAAEEARAEAEAEREEDPPPAGDDELAKKAREHAEGFARKGRARRVPAEFNSVRSAWEEAYDATKNKIDAALSQT